jgi:hypothetical protein
MEALMRSGSYNRKTCSFFKLIHSKILFLISGHTGQTLMNERSSRSHAIFTITIECSDTGPDGGKRIRVGKLHMVDLAVCFLKNIYI